MSLSAWGILSCSAEAATIDRPFFRAGSMVIVFGASDFLEDGGVAPFVGDFYQLTNSGQAANDLIAADMRSINYNTNRLNPINNDRSAGFEFDVVNQTFGGVFDSGAPHQTLGAGDSYTAFGLDSDTDIELDAGGRASRFYVASNAPFDIFAQADNLIHDGAFSALDYSNIRFRLRVQTTGGGGDNRWGQSAQDPSVGGSGVVLGRFGGPRVTLDELAGASPVKVFDGGRRTALARGSILDQAVSFQAQYNLRGSGATTSNYDFSMGTGTLGADVTYTVYTP